MKMKRLRKNAVRGMLAGAAGTAMLNLTTYADVVVRDRPPSPLPEKVIGAIAKNADIGANRKTGLGALLGYFDGLGAGMLFGAIRPYARGVPWQVAGIALGVFTAVLSEGSATALKQTDPRRWTAADWIADMVPRCIYGWTTCVAFDNMRKRHGAGRASRTKEKATRAPAKRTAAETTTPA